VLINTWTRIVRHTGRAIMKHYSIFYKPVFSISSSNMPHY